MSGERLEQRYRKLLRTLPKPYREARGEELLSVLMDGAPEGRQWPELREVFSLAWLGLRVRAAGAGAGAEGGELERTRVGEMARLVALLGVALLAFDGVNSLATLMRYVRGWPHSKPWQILNPFAGHVDGPILLSPHFEILRYEAPGCWLIVLGLLAVGWWRAARLVALVILAVSVFQTLGRQVALSHLQTAVRQEVVLATVVTAALFAARGPHARPARVPGLAAVAALLGVMGYTYRSWGGPLDRAYWALQGQGTTDSSHVMIGAVVVVAGVCVVAYRSSAVVPVALAVVLLAGLVPALADDMLTPWPARPDMIPLLALVSALVVVAALAVVRDRRSRRSAAVPGRGGEAPEG